MPPPSPAAPVGSEGVFATTLWPAAWLCFVRKRTFPQNQDAPTELDTAPTCSFLIQMGRPGLVWSRLEWLCSHRAAPRDPDENQGTFPFPGMTSRGYELRRGDRRECLDNESAAATTAWARTRSER